MHSAYHQGFRRILILNGHGGKRGWIVHFNTVINEMPGLKLTWCDWWTSHSVEQVALTHALKPKKTNRLEAFPFILVSEIPTGPKLFTMVPSFIMNSRTAREVYGNGSIGGEDIVDHAFVSEILKAVEEDILMRLTLQHDQR